jgi:hypothetical protein
MDLDEHEHEHDHDRRAKSVFRRMATRISLSSSQEPSLNTENSINDGGQSLPKLFWPADLLPSDCPNSRILMFGYDSKITKYGTGAINKNSLLAHGKDLLFSLCRERRLERPVIFVAHSLGGIIVKEVSGELPLGLEVTRELTFIVGPNEVIY